MNRNFLSTLLLASALSTGVATPLYAQSIEELKAQLEMLSKRIEELEKKQAAAPQGKVAEIKKAGPALTLATDDGLFEFKLRGRLYADAGWAHDNDDAMNVAGTELRAARIGIEGKAWGKIGYRFEADFAGNTTTVNDAFITYPTSFGKVTVGNFKTPNSLEEQTSSRFVTFIERGAFTDAFNLARQLGVSLSNGGDNWTFKAAVFRGSVSDTADEQGTTLAGRVTYGGKFDNGAWMLGGSVRYQEASEGAQYRYRQRTYHHLSDRLLATGFITDEDFMYGLEAAAQMGAFHASAEWASLSAKDGGSAARNATFSGGYVEAGWFITGESRPLKLSSGVWDRAAVNSPIHKGGVGAWEVAAKYDIIDLTDNGVFGGEMDTIVIGLNWYLNRHARVMANYSHSTIDDAFDVAANGADGENSADTFGLRFQIDW